jgi:hypothetical protein
VWLIFLENILIKGLTVNTMCNCKNIFHTYFNKVPFLLILFLSLLYTSCTEKSRLKTKIQKLDEKYLRSGRADYGLIQALGTYCNLFPADKTFDLKYADYLMRAHYFQSAADFLFGKITHDRASSPELINMYLHALQENGNLDSLKSFFIKFPEYKPIFSTYIVIGDSIGYFNNLLKSGSSPDYYYARSRFYVMLDDPEPAIWDINKYVDMVGLTTESSFKKAYLCFNLKKDSMALACLEQFDSMAVSNKIVLTEKFKDLYSFLLKLDQINKIIAKDASLPMIKKRLHLYVEAAEYSRALDELNNIIPANQTDADLYAMRAYVNFMSGNLGQANKDIDIAEKISGRKNTALAKMIRNKAK